MKIFNIRTAILLLTATSLVGCFKKDPKSDQEKISYAIGQQLGQNIKAQNIDINTAMLNQAITEAIEGKKPRMTPAEVQASMQMMQKQSMEKKKEEAKKNKELGEKFLAENKTKEGVKTTKSGLQYKIIKEGKGKKPKTSSEVKVHYTGQLIDGTEFDSSKKRDQPAEFPVNGVIKGWQEVLPLMPVGSTWKVFVPSDLAYGERGRPRIPANSVLIFEINLIEIVK